MTGVDRLRALAGAWDELGLGGALADIAEQIERERDAEVADSPYDAILPEDRDALAWVRDHGGIDHVKAEWRSRVPYDRYERRRQNLLRHINECETALGRRNRRISELEGRVKALMNENAELRKRAMPEGCEWPRYESGDLVMFGDCVENRNGTCTVNSVRFYSGGGVSVYGEARGAQFVVVTEPVMRDPIRKARPKVLAADGEPLLKHETVYEIKTGERYFVTNVFDGMTEPDFPEHTVECRKYEDVVTHMFRPSQLTHTKPEPVDTWERIEEDARLKPTEYTDRYRVGRFGFESEDMRADLVRRCRALAERERGE